MCVFMFGVLGDDTDAGLFPTCKFLFSTSMKITIDISLSAYATLVALAKMEGRLTPADHLSATVEEVLRDLGDMMPRTPQTKRRTVGPKILKN